MSGNRELCATVNKPWRLGTNGSCIVCGEGVDREVVAVCPSSAVFDKELAAAWIDRAEHIVELHNAWLDR